MGAEHSGHNVRLTCHRQMLLGIEREIVIMKLIEHPNVLRLMDVWETGNDL